MGPVGSGKTTAIRTISDIEVVDTDERATDDVSKMKSHTTVSMDVGVLKLDDKDKLRIYGTPGQDRFDFMWDILIEQTKGVFLVINHGSKESLKELGHYYKELEKRRSGRNLPIVICVTHIDKNTNEKLEIYREFLIDKFLIEPENIPPILSMDARDKAQVRSAMVVMTALLEMSERFPKISQIK